MVIKECIDSPRFLNELPKINNLLSSRAEATISPGGTRVVAISGYEGSIALDELSRKILSTSLRNRSDDENGMRFINHLIHFYNITDDQIEQSNLVTKTLSKIREFPLFDKPLRHQLGFLKEEIEYPQIDDKKLKENAIAFVRGRDYSDEILSYINEIIEDDSFQRSPKYFMDKWRERRGFTREFRIVEDSARMFFEQQLHL